MGQPGKTKQLKKNTNKTINQVVSVAAQHLTSGQNPCCQQIW